MIKFAPLESMGGVVARPDTANRNLLYKADVLFALIEGQEVYARAKNKDYKVVDSQHMVQELDNKDCDQNIVFVKIRKDITASHDLLLKYLTKIFWRVSGKT